ncbi:MAG: ATP-binding protein [Dissulfurispiraceae bacterium]|jgi:signal transduction histidine kinase|nr:ATP-binding protein [Dissulfurispiraceae bacterium]
MDYHSIRSIFDIKSLRPISLRSKIAISFNISAFIILLLVAFEYFNFIEIKNEIKYLENSDSIRRISLQLRRREASYLLNGWSRSKDDSDLIHKHLGELSSLLSDKSILGSTDNISELQFRINEYSKRFKGIEELFSEAASEFKKIKPLLSKRVAILPLIESLVFIDTSQYIELLNQTSSLPHNHKLIFILREINTEISDLKSTGEEILRLTRALDRSAIDNVEIFIKKSQIAIMILFPLFLTIGIGTLFFLSNNIVNRLKALIKVVESTGSGNFTDRVPLAMFKYKDEIGILIKKLDEMDDNLIARDKELQKKNIELLQSKKLAAIGTLAAGVAHEINNPLNNMKISAQVLSKEARMDCTGSIYDTVEDIVSQIERVKKLVEDLLNFARGREPFLSSVNIVNLIKSSYNAVCADRDADGIKFNLDSPEEVNVDLDSLQMERVFINLFSNAVDAMTDNSLDYGKVLNVSVTCPDNSVVIVVSDNGCGISPESIEHVFEPFYTTKIKGTGLGLSIVFSIIAKHKGQISVDRIKDRGTLFTIVLPRSINCEI